MVLQVGTDICDWGRLASLSELRDKPAGTIRITAGEYAADTVLWPALARLLPDYPDIKVEIIVDYGLTDIVTERYDAGVRLGEQVAKNMIAVRIGPDMRMAVVGAPSYFTTHKPPKTPQDLTAHDCINLRLPTYGGLYAWEFEKHGRGLTLPTGALSVCSPTGARPFQAATSTTRAEGRTHRPLPCSSTRCAIAAETRGCHWRGATPMSASGRFTLGFPCLVVLAPGRHDCHRIVQAKAERRDRVFHARRHLVIGAPADQPVGFHLPQLLREHLLADARQQPAQFGEAVWPQVQFP
jgi:hypothetical protein